MSLRNRIVLPVVFSALAVLVGCGGGSGNPNPVPPPSGSFSNSDLNGTYTFSVAGANGNGFFTMAGSFVACGCSAGTISSGTADLADPTGPSPASPIGSNSVYSISSDGRGQARLLLTTIGNVATEIDLDFVLTSSSHGLIIRYDGNGTGSGTLDLQPAAVAQSSLDATPYAFSFSGSDTAGTPLATVGAFTLDSSGAITTGVEDFNYGASPSTALPLTGSVTVGSGTAPGTAMLITSFGTFTFDVYTIDATHLKLIENDTLTTSTLLIGDVLTQTSATIPAGNLVFTMSGLDTGGDLFVTGGVMAPNGSGVIVSGTEDVNDAGVLDNNTNPATPLTFTGNYSATGGGRFLLNLSAYFGGTQFAAYPSSGGLLMLEVDSAVSGVNAGVTGGVAMTQQTGATVSASQGYGMSLSGEDLSVLGSPTELDDIAEFTTTSTGMKGLMDLNDAGLGTTTLNGTYSVATGGFGSATFTSGGLGGMFFYAVDDSTAMLISTDSTQAALGSFVLQTPSASGAKSSVVRAASMPMLRVIPHTASQKNRKRGTKAN